MADPKIIECPQYGRANNLYVNPFHCYKCKREWRDEELEA